ncbi:uncharacterized protein LOC133184451 [Saccostrea echinata]|uniref:uncharacterized protein LOC133184451 n=1 Tax=Saccostrea echinata TaxID=191078 RepID=UPI002A80FEDF|nr:uncharacterized protein LOC133184451 [Saccostrea echinata]
MEEDELDRLKLPKTRQVAREREIDISGLKNIGEIRCTLKRHLLKDRKSRDSVIQGLSSDAENDSILRMRLGEIYVSTLQALHDLKQSGDTLLDHLDHCFPSLITNLENEQSKLLSKNMTCPIMVLGETGSGKSSFINLLLGCELLPHSLLSNTNTICEIQYGDDYKACFHPIDNAESKMEIGFGSLQEMQGALSDKIQKKGEQKSLYKRVEIFLPSDILKSGLLIVDSPGIADTGEMTDIVLDYLIKACAFIYIINSENAGGVAPDRLQYLLKKVVEKAFHDEQDYRSTCAIFICNKWDQVPFEERSRVYQDTVKKLCTESTGWPGCKEDQIFRLSTKEAMFIQQTPEKFIVGRFAAILQKINNLIPESRNTQLLNSARLLQQVLDKAAMSIESSLSDVHLTAEQRMIKNKETVEDLTKLKKDVYEFFEVEKKNFDKGLEDLIKELRNHLQNEKKVEELCNFTQTMNISNVQWKEATIKVRIKLYDSITEEIQKWETENKKLEVLGANMAKNFQKQFPDFDSKLFNLQKRYIQHNQSVNIIDENTEPFVPIVIAEKFDNINLGLKVLVGISFSPVLLIGALVRLPVWGIRELARKVKGQMLEAEYCKDPRHSLMKYAEGILKSTSDPMKMKPIMEKEVSHLFKYLENQRRKVLQQIDAELTLLDKRKEEKQTREFIAKNCSSQKVRFERFRRRLTYFYKIELTPTSYMSFSDFEEERVLWQGLFGDACRVISKDVSKTGDHAEVVVVKNCYSVDEVNIMEHMRVEEAYRSNKFVYNIPLLCMILRSSSEHHFIWPVLCPVKCSLREFMDSKTIEAVEKIHTLYLYMEQVISGLDFLHTKKLVHLDVSQDSVMVDQNKRIKLIHITYPQRLNASNFPEEATGLKKYMYFHRDVLSLPSQTEYSFKHDMYGVGLMMWEVWRGQRAFQEMIDSPESKTLHQFIRFLSDDKNHLSLDVEDGLGIPQVNFWNDGILMCQSLSITAAGLLDLLHPCKNKTSDYKHAQVHVFKSQTDTSV